MEEEELVEYEPKGGRGVGFKKIELVPRILYIHIWKSC